jgi:hypothetical protein
MNGVEDDMCEDTNRNGEEPVLPSLPSDAAKVPFLGGNGFRKGVDILSGAAESWTSVFGYTTLSDSGLYCGYCTSYVGPQLETVDLQNPHSVLITCPRKGCLQKYCDQRCRDLDLRVNCHWITCGGPVISKKFLSDRNQDAVAGLVVVANLLGRAVAASLHADEVSENAECDYSLVRALEKEYTLLMSLFRWRDQDKLNCLPCVAPSNQTESSNCKKRKYSVSSSPYFEIESDSYVDDSFAFVMEMLFRSTSGCHSSSRLNHQQTVDTAQSWLTLTRWSEIVFVVDAYGIQLHRECPISITAKAVPMLEPRHARFHMYEQIRSFLSRNSICEIGIDKCGLSSAPSNLYDEV